MTKIEGSIERITYYNQDNGYTVLRLRPKSKKASRMPGLNLEGLLTVVGNLPELTVGEQIRLEGDYVTHQKHGLQFKTSVCEKLLPATSAGIERYLGSGLIKGIGPQLAKRIVKHFKTKTLEVIENDPQILKEVPGIGPDRTEKIIKAWEEQKQIKEIMLFLHGHQVSTNLAVKIYKTYGDQSLKIVKDNPYQLEQDIYGVGFKTADRIAKKLGLQHDHPSRIEAGIVYSINEMVSDGHVYSPVQPLTEQAVALLEVEKAMIRAGLERLASQDRIRSEIIPTVREAPTDATPKLAEASVTYGEPIVYLTPFFHSEKGVAKRLTDLLAHPIESKQKQLISDAENLSLEQRNALEQTLSSSISIITGGPGTGKTTCLKALIQRLELHGNVRYALVSPTGRAAKRLSEATGRPASTIHRMLAYKPGQGFKYHEKNPLNIDFLIIDEASMLDLLLTYHLLRALKGGTQVLFVGDVDQLPSVGAGDVLRDLIACGEIPVSRLSTIFRQSSDSQIITNAHRVNQGKMPKFSKTELGDFFLFPAEDAEKAAEWVVDLVSNRIPERFGMDPVNDIQVLTPLYRGAAGVDALNELLQEKLNPANIGKSEQKLFGRLFRVGDKVMQVRNNYDKDVYNGDIGTIAGIDLVDQKLILTVDGVREVLYDFNEADELVLAYAVTVHKAQGSEFPAIVMPVITQHYIMLQRNLLYTGVTRAKQLCVLIGNHKALSIAINNNKVSHRFSLLSQRIKTK